MGRSFATSLKDAKATSGKFMIHNFACSGPHLPFPGIRCIMSFGSWLALETVTVPVPTISVPFGPTTSPFLAKVNNFPASENGILQNASDSVQTLVGSTINEVNVETTLDHTPMYVVTAKETTPLAAVRFNTKSKLLKASWDNPTTHLPPPANHTNQPQLLKDNSPLPSQSEPDHYLNYYMVFMTFHILLMVLPPASKWVTWATNQLQNVRI